MQAASEKNADGTVLDHLGDACQKLGKAEDARNAWRRAVESFRKQKEEEKAAAVETKLK